VGRARRTSPYFPTQQTPSGGFFLGRHAG